MITFKARSKADTQHTWHHWFLLDNFLVVEIHEEAWTVEHIIVKSFNKWGISSALDSIGDEVMCDKNKTWTIRIVQTGRVFYQGYISEKLHKSKLCKLYTKFPFKIAYFLEVTGMTTSSCIMYDYLTRGHTDLYSTVYTVHVHFYTYLLTYSMEQSPSWEPNWFCS
jgi:hypothetical protein